jgi:hypothetical protein
MKYDQLIRALEDNKIYTPSTIAVYAVETGWVDTRDPEQRRLEMLRVRVAMGRFSNNHAFPDNGDGMVNLPGQSPTPGWYGWRWKEARRKTKVYKSY